MNPEFKKKCIVVLTAGGESSRFRSVLSGKNIQKAVFVLPTGETMIERTIQLYKAIGLNHFVILVYHNAESVKNALGDGTAFGVSITYSVDPEKPVGRGGAIKHALDQGIIDKDSYIIVHNPDDQLVNDPTRILEEAIEIHMQRERQGALATAVMVQGTAYDFTGFKVEDGFVTGVEMYPFIDIPTHVGLTLFSPGATKYFETLFSLDKKTDFEAVLFPVLNKEKKLAAHLIPASSWISVNDEKGLKKLLKALEISVSNL
jgi:NDP-sugar pyrophosphorylase family protein